MPQIAIQTTPTGLILKPEGGPGLYANYLWLRDNAPDAWDAVTRDRVSDVTTLPLDLIAQDVQVEGDSLVISWSDGANSRFDLGWLTGWLSTPGRDDVARLDAVPWRAEKQVARFEFEAILGDWATRCRYLETMIREGLALVEGVPDAKTAVTQIAEIAGIVRGGFSGQYFNVRTYPKPAGSAYTANALEPHTDNPCEEAPPTIQYLHCLQNDATGGQSTFADGLATALDLKAADPQGFKALATHDLPFRFCHDGIDMRARQKVILTDHSGAVTGVTVSQHMADIFDLDQHLCDLYYPAFIRFLRMLRAPEYEITFTLRAGDCVVFDNQRIVHGRRAFDPTSGGRMLRGCYSDRGELRSRYRALLAEGAIRDQKPQGAD